MEQMKFKDAMLLLEQGKKVTRKQYYGSIYFIKEGNEIKSYQPRIDVYMMNEGIMISDGWIIDGLEGEHKFYDIIEELTKGKKASRSGWSSESYVSYDPSGKQLVYNTMIELPFQPSFDCFMASDWIEIK